MLRVDSLVEMVTVPDTALVIPDGEINMLADENTAVSDANVTRGGRGGKTKLTRGSRRGDTN